MMRADSEFVRVTRVFRAITSVFDRISAKNRVIRAPSKRNIDFRTNLFKFHLFPSRISLDFPAVLEENAAAESLELLDFFTSGILQFSRFLNLELCFNMLLKFEFSVIPPFPLHIFLFFLFSLDLCAFD